LQEFCTIDYDRDMTLVATITRNDVEQVIGWALFTRTAEDGFAEAAFLVADEWQGRGIGTHLMRRLTEIAEARGVQGFKAIVLATNASMLRVFEKCGYPVEKVAEGEMIRLRIPFAGQARESWAAADRNAAAEKGK
ncbi:MAG: GNAT family N-acetyltransferase, partial [Planctomycetota bacterium]